MKDNQNLIEIDQMIVSKSDLFPIHRERTIVAEYSIGTVSSPKDKPIVPAFSATVTLTDSFDASPDTSDVDYFVVVRDIRVVPLTSTTKETDPVFPFIYGYLQKSNTSDLSFAASLEESFKKLLPSYKSYSKIFKIMNVNIKPIHQKSRFMVFSNVSYHKHKDLFTIQTTLESETDFQSKDASFKKSPLSLVAADILNSQFGEKEKNEIIQKVVSQITNYSFQ